MNSVWTKVLSVVLKNSPLIVISIMLIIAGGLGYQWYKSTQENQRLHQELVGQVEKYVQLSDGHARLETDYASEKRLNEEAEKEWATERKDLKGKIKALANASFKGGTDEHVIKTDVLYHEVSFRSDGQLGPALGFVKFEEIELRDGTIDGFKSISAPFRHEIQVKAAIIKDEETGRVSIFTKAYWLQLETPGIDPVNNSWINVPYPLNITGGRIIIDPTEPIDPQLKSRFMWALHGNLGLFAGASNEGLNYGAAVDISLWGYGTTPNDLDWKLGTIGANFGNDYADVHLIPVSYRVGKHLPLVSDLWLGAGIGRPLGGGETYFLTLSTTL